MRVSGVGQSSLDHILVVDHYPDVDTKIEALEWHEQCGGPVSTALVTLSRLGARCRFYGLVGEDYAGREIARSLAEENIDIRGVVKREGTASQIAFIAVEKMTASRTIFWKRPSGTPLKASELPDDFLADTDFLLLDGLMPEVSLFAADKAKELRVPVMLDAGRKRPGMIELAKLSEYVVASEEFARDFGWKLSPEALQDERQTLGIGVLTVTLGDSGSITVSHGGSYQIPAFKIDAVDTTGAGDVFHGGYVYGLLRGWGLEETVIFASAMAAMKCTRIGGRKGIPGLQEVEEFLTEKGHSIPGLNPA